MELPGDEAALAGRVALAELLALRSLLLNLHFRAAKGEPMPEPEMRALIERADGAKMRAGAGAAGGGAAMRVGQSGRKRRRNRGEEG